MSDLNGIKKDNVQRDKLGIRKKISHDFASFKIEDRKCGPVAVFKCNYDWPGTEPGSTVSVFNAASLKIRIKYQERDHYDTSMEEAALASLELAAKERKKNSPST